MTGLSSHSKAMAGKASSAARMVGAMAVRGHQRASGSGVPSHRARAPAAARSSKQSLGAAGAWQRPRGAQLGLKAEELRHRSSGVAFEEQKHRPVGSAEPVEGVVQRLREEDRRSSVLPVSLDFNDGEAALRGKSTFELARAAAVFKICAVPMIVRNARSMYNLATRFLGQRIPDYAVDLTFFGHFCGGKSSDEMKPIVTKLGKNHIGAILDYAVEADVESSPEQSALETHREQCDENARIIMRAIDASAEAAEEGGMPGIAAMKITGLGNPQLLERLTTILSTMGNLEVAETYNNLVGVLDETERIEYNEILNRVEAIAAYAKDKGVMMLVDAEQTYMQGAIDHFAICMMRRYNIEGPVVYNTYQCYRVDAEERVLADLQDSSRHGYHFAAKIVRGAYMVQERALAEERGYADPIHKTKADTHNCYNAVVRLILEWKANLPLDVTPSQQLKREKAGLMLATHNEDSVKLCVSKMAELGLNAADSNVYFGQLQGMCDHVSFTLGQQRFFVYKYLPYGPIREVMPYLLRRAEENADVMEGVGKERRLITTELKRRLGTLLGG